MLCAQQHYGGKRFHGGHVAAAGHHHFGVAIVVGCPFPGAETGGAMRDGFVDGEPLRRRLLAGHDQIDVVTAAQAVIGNREQRVGVGRQIDADHVGLLVQQVIDEAGVLVRKAVVILAPDQRTEQIVERRDRLAPGNLARDLEPLGVLVDHGVDDVDEGLVAGEEAMTAGEQIAFEPALAHVFAQHFHHAAGLRKVFIDGQRLGHPGSLPVPVITSCRRLEAVSSGPKTRKFFVSMLASITACSMWPRMRVDSTSSLPAALDLDGEIAEVGHLQRLQEQAAVGVGVHAHAQPALGRDVGETPRGMHPSRRRVLRVCSCASTLRAGAGDRVSRATPRTEPGARARCFQPACRRQTLGRSSPWGCA